MKKIIYFVAALFLWSCSDRQKQEPVETIEEIKVDVKNTDVSFDLSPYFSDSWKAILLETTDECLISDILKIHVEDDIIYISDRVTQFIYLFDINGRFLNRIGKLGGGPEEYVALGNFFVKDELIYVEDSPRERIVIYNSDNEFVNAIKEEVYHHASFIVGESIYYVVNNSSNEYGSYLLYSKDLPKFNNMKAFFPFDESIEEKQMRWGLKNFATKCDDSFLFIVSNNDTIYKVSENEISAFYKISFSDKKVTQDVLEKGGSFAMDKALCEDLILGVDAIHNFGKFLFFPFSNGSEGQDIIYDKVEKKAQVATWLLVNDLGKLYTTEYSTIGDKFIILQNAYLFKNQWNEYYSKNSFKNDSDRERFRKLAEDMKEDDNPVVFLFNLKEIQ